ncbi:DUF732 domain-containing protein [Mycolicibacterium sp. CBMA 226]|uniref:DUF732 domain-containing protein n=1 Tax=Mycolicibacterium sp. CBMA 226 TaxID=2606611 RepID=UPI0012DD6C29|nr:DUF732 domain-containing protein [Mycolicibacterium sp. CBMA 226]MUL74462.1 DUF732 domain-containing protein [Mycolicibacterium sp. CBMA 226]
MRARVSVLCAMTVIALAGPAIAHADARDDDFVNNLAGQGIVGEPDKLVSTAHTVCTTSTQASMVPAGLGRMMPMGYVLSSLRLSIGQIGPFIDTARETYCPPPAPPAAPATADGDAPPAQAASVVPTMAGLPATAGMASLPGIPGIPGMDRLSSTFGATP